MEREVGRVTPLGGDDMGTMIELPTVMDGKMRADALVAEYHRTHQDNPDVPDEAIKGFELPNPKLQGIDLRIDPTDRYILVNFKGKCIAVIRWARDSGKFLIKKHLVAEPGIATQQPVTYYTGLLGAWGLCREYGITVTEFQQAFKDMPPQVKWTFEQCPWKVMDCNLAMAGDPQSQAVPDMACRKCKARFGMDEHGNLHLKEAGQDPRPGAPPFAPPSRLEGATFEIRSITQDTVDAIAAAPILPAPLIPFDRDFLRYKNTTKAKLDQLFQEGIDSWQGVVERGVNFPRSKLGWKKDVAEEIVEVAKEKTGG